MDIWNPEFLSKLEMDSNKELFYHLSIEALKSGFKLCSRYGFLEPYGKFYCSKGRISKKTTNKSGCPFSISTIVKRYPDGKIKYGIKIDNSLNLNHVGHVIGHVVKGTQVLDVVDTKSNCPLMWTSFELFHDVVDDSLLFIAQFFPFPEGFEAIDVLIWGPYI